MGMAGYKATGRTRQRTKGAADIRCPKNSTREIRLTRISVDIRYGGLGVGSWLVKAVMALALTREAGKNPNYEKDILPFTPFVLSTTNRQAWSRFYGRLGYSEDSSQATSDETIQRTMELNEQLMKMNRDPMIFINMRREVSKLALIQDLLIPLEALNRYPEVMVDLPLPVARWVESADQILPSKPKDGSLICDINKLDPFSMVGTHPKMYKMTYRTFRNIYYDKILKEEQTNIRRMMRRLPAQAEKTADLRYTLSLEEIGIIEQWEKELERLYDKAGPFQGNPPEAKIKDIVKRLTGVEQLDCRDYCKV